MGSTALFVAKIMAAIAAFVLAVALALITGKFWEPSKTTVLWLACVTGGLALVSSVSGAWADYRGRQRKLLDRHVASHIRTAYWNIEREVHGEIDPRDLGIGVYRLGWDRPRLAGGRPYWKTQRLIRLHRERPRNHNETTGLIWRPGKGVIGACVEARAVSYADVGATWADHRSDTELVWKGLDTSVTQGLSFAEFGSLVNSGKRLGVVVASPILKDGKVVGCVAVDGPTGTPSLELLTDQKVKDHLSDTATAIGMLL